MRSCTVAPISEDSSDGFSMIDLQILRIPRCEVNVIMCFMDIGNIGNYGGYAWICYGFGGFEIYKTHLAMTRKTLDSCKSFSPASLGLQRRWPGLASLLSRVLLLFTPGKWREGSRNTLKLCRYPELLVLDHGFPRLGFSSS